MLFFKYILKNYKNLPIYWHILVLYLLSTGVATVFFEPKIILSNRIIFIVVLLVTITLSHFFKKQKAIIQLILAYAFLGVIYKETAIIHPLFFNTIDPILIKIDNFLFGFQPSLLFSEIWHKAWFSELMFLGYFSYYLMPLAIIFSIRNKSELIVNQFGTTLIGSFVVYYTIFILIPAVGPQYFFTYPENTIISQGIFGDIIKTIQSFGEAPTAAFPSSHVGISTIVLLWLWNNNRKLMFALLPFSIILTFSTVYIKAHYAIDVIVGLISGTIIYLIINDYNKRSIKQ